MGKLTFVVEFEDGKEPPVSANLDVAGGRLVSVLFGDYRDDFFQPEEVDVVREALAVFWATLLHQIIINKPRKVAWKGVTLRRH
ncbi:TPA: hypothetical protein KKL34_002812 [Escherichia coli]|nr:hypothetical protein [Escherichia coli]HBD5293491.1 hypothetical protein [Escherichia coli]